MTKAANRMTGEDAEVLALDCLGFLAGRTEAFQRFTELSGLDPATVKSRVREHDFLSSILDFILTDEGLLVDFCGSRLTDARDLHVARHMLGGA